MAQMTQMGLAINKDINKEYIEAVIHYENELEQNCLASIDTYINLAFLYWEFASDYGFFCYYNIPDKWGKIGDERYQEIIEMGLKKYPRSVELHFFKKYFPYRQFFYDFTQEECEEIVRKYGDEESLVPYFFLYLFDEDKYQSKRDKLRKQCEELLTAKNRYILSFN